MNDYRHWKRLLESSFNEFVDTLGAYAPNLLAAAVLMLAGLVLASIIKWVIVRVGSGIDKLASRAGIGMFSRMRWPLSDILAGTVYWLVLLFFAAAAAEVLGLPGLADWLGKLIAYLPTVLAGFAIIAAGYIIGGMLRDRVLNAALAANFIHAELLAALVRGLVIVLAIVIGLAQTGLDISFIEHLLTIFAASILAALALAFGLGAGPTVSNIIAGRNVRRHYRIGQRVKVGEVEGEILELTPSFVILDTEGGRTLIPAKVFADDVSVLLDEIGEGQ